jgi:hypothetical protein
MSRGSVLDPLYRKHDVAEFLLNFLQNKKRLTIVTGVGVGWGGGVAIPFNSILSKHYWTFPLTEYSTGGRSHIVQYSTE